ncbi:amino acid ABC transporter substrate-binding protein [Thiolinea disciformis]|uniref:amino acid ABC transporter substrate-binding protein n=1 Tax=Thiolinea disciformis TaxID=125614 RepID=UPI000372A934|nr:amino acid ABC transporter substrate-binding protein [Thiolinea disciformis]
MKKLLLSAAVLTAMVASSAVYAGTTLDAVKKNGAVKCGINTPFPGFANQDEKGNWSGLDIDVCRAVAAAVFGDATKVKFTSLTAKERFTALQSGEVDLLSRNSTGTLGRDTGMGLTFIGANYYDGQGFMVKNSLNVKSAKELDGASVCIQSGTTTELNLADYFRANNMKFEPITYEKLDEVTKAFDEGRCDVLTSDQSQLYSNRITLKDPASATVLPEVISKEPLGPFVRQGDDEWMKIVRWSYYAMVEAEDLGITSANIDEKAKGTDPNIKRFLGLEEGGDANLPLDKKWAYNIVKQVGNYAESFERSVGEGSPLKIKRGLNALWKDGGLQYSPPFR